MWVVDTCVLIDVADADPEFGRPAARSLASCLDRGLLISPISYVELAPVFDDSTRMIDDFLDGAGIDRSATFGEQDRIAAFRAWGRYVHDKRAGRIRRRPVADALIGALALRNTGIITRNPSDFHAFYPALRVLDPTA